jgi:hypothetical protein
MRSYGDPFTLMRLLHKVGWFEWPSDLEFSDG